MVSLARDVDKGVVVVCEAWNEAGHASCDVLGVGIVFKVLVVSIDCDSMGCSHEEVVIRF